MKSEQCVEIYTDGACSGNPGPGGWGVLMRHKQHEKELAGGCLHTTNNRMELTAVIEGLKAIKRACRVEVYTDSQYVHRGVVEWLAKWRLNQWRTADKKAVKNQDLWQLLDKQIQQHEISWFWVKGHNGHPENERADALARAGMQAYLATEKSK